MSQYEDEKRREVRATVRNQIGFNTGRLYQSDGQRITIAEMIDGTVLFCDHSRGISGKLRTDYLPSDNHAACVAAMRLYDANEYDHDRTGRANWLLSNAFPMERL